MSPPVAKNRVLDLQRNSRYCITTKRVITRGDYTFHSLSFSFCFTHPPQSLFIFISFFHPIYLLIHLSLCSSLFHSFIQSICPSTLVSVHLYFIISSNQFAQPPQSLFIFISFFHPIYLPIHLSLCSSLFCSFIQSICPSTLVSVHLYFVLSSNLFAHPPQSLSIFISFFHPIYLPIRLSLCPSLFRSFIQSICPSTLVSVYLYFVLSSNLFAHPPQSLFIFISFFHPIYLPIHLSLCLSLFHSFVQSICPSTLVSVHLYFVLSSNLFAHPPQSLFIFISFFHPIYLPIQLSLCSSLFCSFIQSICPSTFSLCPSLFRSFIQSICPSTLVSVHLYFVLSSNLFAHPPQSLFIFILFFHPIYLPIHLSLCLSLFRSFIQSICPSTLVSVHLYFVLSSNLFAHPPQSLFIFILFFHPIYLPIRLSLCPSLFRSFIQSICPSTLVSVYLYFVLSSNLFAHPPQSLFIFISFFHPIYLPIHLSLCLSLFHSFVQSICPSTLVSVHLYFVLSSNLFAHPPQSLFIFISFFHPIYLPIQLSLCSSLFCSFIQSICPSTLVSVYPYFVLSSNLFAHPPQSLFIFISFFRPIYLPNHLSLCSSLFHSFIQSICPSTLVSVHLYFVLSSNLFAHPPLSLSIFISFFHPIYLPIHLSLCPSLFHSFIQSICPSSLVSVHLYFVLSSNLFAHPPQSLFIFISFFRPIYLPIHLSLCSSLFCSFIQSICPSTFVSVHLYFVLSSNLFAHPPQSLSIFISFFHPIYLPIQLSLCSSLFRSFIQSICPSTLVSVYLYFVLSSNLFAHPPQSLFIFISFFHPIYLPIHLSLCLSLFHSFIQSICPSTLVSVHLYFVLSSNLFAHPPQSLSIFISFFHPIYLPIHLSLCSSLFHSFIQSICPTTLVSVHLYFILSSNLFAHPPQSLSIFISFFHPIYLPIHLSLCSSLFRSFVQSICPTTLVSVHLYFILSSNLFAHPPQSLFIFISFFHPIYLPNHLSLCSSLFRSFIQSICPSTLVSVHLYFVLSSNLFAHPPQSLFIFILFFHPIYLSIHLSLCSSLFHSFIQSICPSTLVSVYLYFVLSSNLFAHPSQSLFIFISFFHPIYLPIHLSLCLSLFRSFIQSICPSTLVSVYLYFVLSSNLFAHPPQSLFIFISFFHPIYLPIHLSLCSSLFRSFIQSICPSTLVSVYLYFVLSSNLFAHPPQSLFIFISFFHPIYLPNHLSLCLSLFRSFIQSICPTTLVSVHLYFVLSSNLFAHPPQSLFIFISFFHPIYLPNHLSLCSSLFCSFIQSICPSTLVSVHLYFVLSSNLFAQPPQSLFIFISFFHPIYLPIHLSLCSSLFRSFIQSICPSTLVSVYLYFVLSSNLFAHPPQSLFIFISFFHPIYLPNHLSLCLSLFRSFIQSIYPTTLVSVHLYFVLSSNLFAHPPQSLFIFISLFHPINLPNHLSLCSSLFRSFIQSICPSTLVSVHLYFVLSSNLFAHPPQSLFIFISFFHPIYLPIHLSLCPSLFRSFIQSICPSALVSVHLYFVLSSNLFAHPPQSLFIFISFFRPIYLPIHLSLCSSLFRSFIQSICPSALVSVHLYFVLSSNLFAHPPQSLFIFISFFRPIYLPIHLSLCSSLFRSFIQSICPSTLVSVYLYFILSSNLFAHPPQSLSIFISFFHPIYLPIHLSLCPSLFRSFIQSICPSTLVSVYLYFVLSSNLFAHPAQSLFIFILFFHPIYLPIHLQSLSIFISFFHPIYLPIHLSLCSSLFRSFIQSICPSTLVSVYLYFVLSSNLFAHPPQSLFIFISFFHPIYLPIHLSLCSSLFRSFIQSICPSTLVSVYLYFVLSSNLFAHPPQSLFIFISFFHPIYLPIHLSLCSSLFRSFVQSICPTTLVSVHLYFILSSNLFAHPPQSLSIFISFFHPIYLPIHLSLCPSLFHSFIQSICPSTLVSVHLYFVLSSNLFAHPPQSLFIFILFFHPIYLPIHLSLCLSLFHSFIQSICPSTLVSVYLYFILSSNLFAHPPQSLFIFISFFHPIYLPIHLSLCPSLFHSFIQSICPSTLVSVHLYFILSSNLFAQPPQSLFIFISFFHPIYLPIHLSLCPSLFHSFIQSICPSTLVSVHLYFVLSSNLFAQPPQSLSIFISFFHPIYLPIHLSLCSSLFHSFIQSICPTTLVSVHLYFVLSSNLFAHPPQSLSSLFCSFIQSICPSTLVSVHLYFVLSSNLFVHPPQSLFIFISFFHPIYLPIHLSLCLSLFRSFIQSICPSTLVSVHLYFVLSSNLFAQPPQSLFIFISFFHPIYLPIHLSLCPSLFRSFIQSICPSTLVSVHLYFVLSSNLFAQPPQSLFIFILFFHPIYLPIHLSLCSSLFRSFIQSICPTTLVSVHLYFVLSSNLFAHPPQSLFIFISFFHPIYLPIHLSLCSSLFRSFIQSICPSTLVSVHLYFVLSSNLFAQPP